MNMIRLIRSELRKLTSTKMPLAFLAVLAVLAGINAFAVIAGTDFDGSKAFIATEADQQSLMAFAANALAIAGLFGAIAAAREYGHHTVVPTFLAAPRRHRAVLAQFGAIGFGGGVLGLVGAGLTAIAVAVSPSDHRLRLPRLDRQPDRVCSLPRRSLEPRERSSAPGSGRSSAMSAERSPESCSTLLIAPPLVVQLASGTASWMPSVLANVVSGVGNDVGQAAAVAAIAAWAVVPAAVGLIAVQRRDVD